MRLLARGLVHLRWVIIGLWAILGVIASIRAPRTPDLLNLRGGSTHPTEAFLADAYLSHRFPRPFSDFFAITVQGPSSFRSGQPRATLDSLVATLDAKPYIRGVISFRSNGDSTFLSKDERTTFFLAAIKVPNSDSVGGIVRPVRRALAEALARLPDRDSYKIEVTGRAPLDLDVRAVSADDSKRLEARLIPLSLIILILAFGALVAALLPLVIGFLAISVSLTVIGLIAVKLPMSVFVINLTSMIGLGVGIDYSLLVVTRFREELKRGFRRKEAAVRTMATAGVAVITSGLIVAVGFGALLWTPLVETRSVGVAGLIVVAVSVLLSITLLPALLAVLGRSIDRPRWLARRLTWYHAPQVWEKWARSLSRHPRRALVVGGIVIAILTAPLVSIRIGLPARSWWPSQTEAGAGVETLTRLGVAGYIQPIRMLVEAREGTAVSATMLRGLRALSDSIKKDPRVREVRSLVDLQPRLSLLGYSLLYSDLDSARAQHAQFLDAYLSTDAKLTLLDVILADTTSLTSGMDVVRHVRAVARSGKIKSLKNTTVSVGGYIAAAVDFQEVLMQRFPLLIGLILATTGLMLAIAFRSVLVPIKAILMNSLSVSATFGLIVLVFQRGVGVRAFGIAGPTEAIFVVVPVLVFAVVFGLSMDYEVFLLSRIKEAFDRSGRNTEATMEGLSATASVITSAAMVMILVFGAFAFARVLVMQFLGFGLALAVLLDATIIRMVLVPAFMHLAGRWNWWPGVRGRSS